MYLLRCHLLVIHNLKMAKGKCVNYRNYVSRRMFMFTSCLKAFYFCDLFSIDLIKYWFYLHLSAKQLNQLSDFLVTFSYKS